MPEVPNAYRCDFCHTLMEEKTERWHTKWCLACGAKLWDTFVPKLGDDTYDNDYGTDAD